METVFSIDIKQVLTIDKGMNDDECFEKVTITVFPPMEGIGIIEGDPVVDDEDVCGDSTGASEMSVPADADVVVVHLKNKGPMTKISHLLERAQMKYGESICIRTASYDTTENQADAIEWLNAALRGSGNNTILDESSFSSFIATSSPIISINNRLSFVGIIPNESQFLSRIAASMRILEEGVR